MIIEYKIVYRNLMDKVVFNENNNTFYTSRRSHIINLYELDKDYLTLWWTSGKKMRYKIVAGGRQFTMAKRHYLEAIDKNNLLVKKSTLMQNNMSCIRCLIIIKFDKIKKQISQNRHKFLNYLNTKPQFTVIDEKDIENIKDYEDKYDIFMYYLINASSELRQFAIPGFDVTKKTKILFIEDIQSVGIISRIVKEHTFNSIVLSKRHARISDKYTRCTKLPISSLDHCLDMTCFKDWGLEKNMIYYFMGQQYQIFILLGID